MEFEWDARKAKSNVRDHDVTFEEAERAFLDPGGVYLEDLVDEYGEQRYHLIAAAESTLLLLIVHCYRTYDGERYTRIISARRATPGERKLYRKANPRSEYTGNAGDD